VTARAVVALGAALALAACAPVPLPRASPYHASDAALGITRVVHGTLILEMRGTRVMVDPWFHSGLFVRQKEPLGLTPDRVPPLAAVLITHEHGSHFDRDALAELAKTVPEAIARPELAPKLTALGFGKVVPLVWWEKAQAADLTITAVPARHGVGTNGYVLEDRNTSVYVAGDSFYFPGLVDIATRFAKLDVALLPIGGQRLLGVKREMSPVEAAKTAAVLRARRVIPIGYGEGGGFPIRWWSRNPTERFVDACKDRGIDASRVVVLEPGESWHYFEE
jgi:L-ascorbate metabolism protein UlaG (beta-lactamase superfamily)